jgi:hypothetical protein
MKRRQAFTISVLMPCAATGAKSARPWRRARRR